MRRVILDTDMLSEVIKRRDANVVARSSAYSLEHGLFTITAISAHEIVFGLSSRNDQQKLNAWTNALTRNDILLPTLEDFLLAGDIRGKARRRGRQIPMDDTLIGAIAVRVGLPVCTGNTEDFRQMQDVGMAVELENWRDPL